MKVVAIIPSLYSKTGGHLKLCVESLRKTVNWDIIVVTNGTKSSPMLDDIKGITAHLHNYQQGQCRAVNVGAEIAAKDADYLFIINDDMVFSPGWNRYLIFDYPVFSPNLIEPMYNGGSAPPFLKSDGGMDVESYNAPRIDEFVMSYNIPPEEVYEDGFNFPFFIRKDVWDAIGGYDIKYDPWGSNSDTDLQTKIELAGIKPKRKRDVLVYHFGSKSGTFSPENQAAWQRNWDLYTAKWGFNRDMEPKGDTWYCKNMIHWDKLKYHPKWEGKYAD